MSAAKLTRRSVHFRRGKSGKVLYLVMAGASTSARATEPVRPSRTGSVALADVLAPAITRYNTFPLFPRRKCTDRLVNFAADIFLGKPCLLVAHHTDFADGGQALVELIAAIR